VSELPPTVDRLLTPRVGMAEAARYLGCSRRRIEIRSGRLPAIDISEPGSKRARWAIAVRDLRGRLALAELQAAKRIEGTEANGSPESSRRSSRRPSARPASRWSSAATSAPGAAPPSTGRSAGRNKPYFDVCVAG